MSNRISQAEILKECASSWADFHFETWQDKELERDPQWTLGFLRGVRWAERRLSDSCVGKCEACKCGIFSDEPYHEDSEGVMWHKACGDENGD